MIVALLLFVSHSVVRCLPFDVCRFVLRVACCLLCVDCGCLGAVVVCWLLLFAFGFVPVGAVCLFFGVVVGLLDRSVVRCLLCVAICCLLIGVCRLWFAMLLLLLRVAFAFVVCCVSLFVA